MCYVICQMDCALCIEPICSVQTLYLLAVWPPLATPAAKPLNGCTLQPSWLKAIGPTTSTRPAACTYSSCECFTPTVPPALIAALPLAGAPVPAAAAAPDECAESCCRLNMLQLTPACSTYRPKYPAADTSRTRNGTGDRCAAWPLAPATAREAADSTDGGRGGGLLLLLLLLAVPHELNAAVASDGSSTASATT